METKKCVNCKEELEISHFWKGEKQNGKIYYDSHCIKCMSIRSKFIKRNCKELCLKYKNTYECSKCGYNKCFAALEFHHINPEEKDIKISSFNTITLTVKMKKELDKCIVVCSNCHRELHFEDNIKYEYNPHNKILYCVDCHNPIDNRQNKLRCGDCQLLIRTNPPQKEELVKIFNKIGTVKGIAKYYNIKVDNARKWLQDYDIILDFKRPSKEQLINDILKIKNLVKIGKKYLVHGDTIKKWCVYHNIDYKNIKCGYTELNGDLNVGSVSS